MYTASSIFLKSLAQADISHVFVNWGSDHPALLEELERQRVEQAQAELQIVTCPNEMVALSAAQGYGQVTGKPAAVVIHVDVGTQALAGAIHNADRSRTPILIYAGASPFSVAREHKGTRNEWIMWLQDIPDQTAIVRQYMRHTAQMNSAHTIPNTIQRALQIATSDPQGPVYLWARREVMEEEVTEERFKSASAAMDKWPSVTGAGLAPSVVETIAKALSEADNPLIVTSYVGKNKNAVQTLCRLSTYLAIPIISTVPQIINYPFDHPYGLGVTYLNPGSHTSHLKTADVILVIDCELPWIPANQQPKEDARIFFLDSADPLKTRMGYFHCPAEVVCKADAEVALTQITNFILGAEKEGLVAGEGIFASKKVQDRDRRLIAEYREYVKSLDKEEESYPVVPNDADPFTPTFTIPNLFGVVRTVIEQLTPSKGDKVLILNESISNYPLVWGHMRPQRPGSMLSSGGSSLGWSLGAAVGGYLGGAAEYDLVVVLVGDGSYMFGVPSSAFWMARKYNTPFLTVILNNGGWRSPKYSMTAVHPDGHGSKASGEKLTVGFGPNCPDYSQIAVAASSGWAWGRKIGVGEHGGKEKLKSSVAEAVKVVLEERRCAVLDCVLESI